MLYIRVRVRVRVWVWVCVCVECWLDRIYSSAKSDYVESSLMDLSLRGILLVIRDDLHASELLVEYVFLEIENHVTCATR